MTNEVTMREAQIDGRTQRRTRNIDAVVDAVIELARQGNLDPTSQEIAAIAGISHRSIYRYFDTRAELLEAAVRRAFDSVSETVLGSSRSGGSLDERIDGYVAERVELYRRFHWIAQAAALGASGNTSSVGLERARTTTRVGLADRFERELGELEADERGLTVAVVDAVFQFEALDYLTGNVGLSDEQLRQSLSMTLRRHLLRN